MDNSKKRSKKDKTITDKSKKNTDKEITSSSPFAATSSSISNTNTYHSVSSENITDPAPKLHVNYPTSSNWRNLRRNYQPNISHNVGEESLVNTKNFPIIKSSLGNNNISNASTSDTLILRNCLKQYKPVYPHSNNLAAGQHSNNPYVNAQRVDSRHPKNNRSNFSGNGDAQSFKLLNSRRHERELAGAPTALPSTLNKYTPNSYSNQDTPYLNNYQYPYNHSFPTQNHSRIESRLARQNQERKKSKPHTITRPEQLDRSDNNGSYAGPSYMTPVPTTNQLPKRFYRNINSSHENQYLNQVTRASLQTNLSANLPKDDLQNDIPSQKVEDEYSETMERVEPIQNALSLEKCRFNEYFKQTIRQDVQAQKSLNRTTDLQPPKKIQKRDNMGNHGVAPPQGGSVNTRRQENVSSSFPMVIMPTLRADYPILEQTKNLYSFIFSYYHLMYSHFLQNICNQPAPRGNNNVNTSLSTNGRIQSRHHSIGTHSIGPLDLSINQQTNDKRYIASMNETTSGEHLAQNSGSLNYRRDMPEIYRSDEPVPLPHKNKKEDISLVDTMQQFPKLEQINYYPEMEYNNSNNALASSAPIVNNQKYRDFYPKSAEVRSVDTFQPPTEAEQTLWYHKMKHNDSNTSAPSARTNNNNQYRLIGEYDNMKFPRQTNSYLHLAEVDSSNTLQLPPETEPIRRFSGINSPELRGENMKNMIKTEGNHFSTSVHPVSSTQQLKDEESHDSANVSHGKNFNETKSKIFLPADFEQSPQKYSLMCKISVKDHPEVFKWVHIDKASGNKVNLLKIHNYNVDPATQMLEETENEPVIEFGGVAIQDSIMNEADNIDTAACSSHFDYPQDEIIDSTDKYKDTTKAEEESNQESKKEYTVSLQEYHLKSEGGRSIVLTRVCNSNQATGVLESCHYYVNNDIPYSIVEELENLDTNLTTKEEIEKFFKEENNPAEQE